jgi:hypothetical protein
MTSVPAQKSCTASATDYTPRDAASAGKRLPACVSDSGKYTPINPDVPSNSRIAAVEAVLRLLKVGADEVPSASAFDDVRVLYTQPEGLDSRVSRREDIHFAEVEIAGIKRQCRDLTPAELQLYPDRCAGPVKVVPLINDALREGAAGNAPRVQAARIEAAMVWFMWLSLYKESQGCYADPKQCDSTSSYWGGNQDVNAAPTGYGRYVKTLSEESYKRGWDAVLAIRCAYDYFVSSAPEPADFPTVREKAREQVDRVNNHALALILRARLGKIQCDPAAFAFVRTLAPVLNVVAKAKDPAKASELAAELSKAAATDVNVGNVDAILSELFGCP